jgi:hypothetical protein
VIDPPPPHNPDYLAKDYESFRGLMLDHLMAVAPGTAVDVAGVEATLIEALAYVGDYLSYYQDAVATEACLMTARRRISVRRHARLLDYHVSEGCSARVWVQLQAAGDHVEVPKGTALLTKIPQIDAVRVPGDYAAPGREVFETLHDAVLIRAHNVMALSDPRAPPRAGHTQARLAGSLARLAAGDVLIFRHSAELRAHPVRLASVSAEAGSTAIAWHDEDALPADMPAGGTWEVLGNIVLADHGRSDSQPLPPARREGMPELSIDCPELAYAVPYRHDEAIGRSAARAMRQDPRAAEPALVLRETAAFLTDAALARRPVWTGRREIIHAGQFDRCFAVEAHGDGRLTLRFGDGLHGRRLQPDWGYSVGYRSGRGTGGNIGPNTLAHIVTDDDRILAVTNPLAATGGADPETLDRVRAQAPLAADVQRRCVTDSDYVAITNRFPGVRASSARRDWTPARSLVSIHVARRWDRQWDRAFCAGLLDYLAAFQLVGDELALSGADYVAPIVALELEVEPGRPRSDIVAAVRARLTGLTFEFGETLDPARLVAVAEEVPGVIAARAAGTPLTVAPAEIIRLDPARIEIGARLGR